jgi:hypothetical protein
VQSTDGAVYSIVRSALLSAVWLSDWAAIRFDKFWSVRWLLAACKCAYECALAMQLLFFHIFVLNR